MRPCSLGKEERLRKNYEFRQVYDQGRRVASRYFIIYWMEGDPALRDREARERRRLGLSVSKKIGNAVKRNRAKRLLRETFRRNKECIGPGVDLVVVGRKGLEEQDYSTVETLLVEALKRIEQSRRRPAPNG